MNDDELAHIGVKRRSGRYPWGSGEDPGQHGSSSFGDTVRGLRSNGLSEVDIAKGMGMNSKELRARLSIEKNARRAADVSEALTLRDKGLSPTAIGRKMGINESSVRSLLNPSAKARTDQFQATADLLKTAVDSKGVIDIGAGTEQHLNVSATRLSTAAALLKDQGYRVDSVNVQQLGTGKLTKVKVLSPPGMTYGDVVKAANTGKVATLAVMETSAGEKTGAIRPPVSLNSSRIAIRYGPDGGSNKDGVIEVRRNVGDLSLGASRYAQVRVAVDGTHYMKGMAMYADDLPKGVDVRFNTNKANTGNKLDALKPMNLMDNTKPLSASNPVDQKNPFGAVIKTQRQYVAKDGSTQQSVLNIIGEEGDWSKWSKSLSSQVLSKQSPQLAKDQLNQKFLQKKAEFDEAMSLTNPAVKKVLLDSLADDADSQAVHLKAAALPRQGSHIILPIDGMKDTEVYAPNYHNGEKVVLIRHPHGGKFEIPELTVNNRVPHAKSLIENAIDAVGISPAVAARLSGADFDGDTVLVIPNHDKRIKTEPALHALKNFDPKVQYPYYEGMHVMSKEDTQHKMGDISNLITDMTIKGANNNEIARAVKHSMVVIDANKHKLNYKQSALDNGITELKARYQMKPDGKSGGAATLLSRAKSEQRVDKLYPRPALLGGPIDPKTGKKVFLHPGDTYVNSQGKTIVVGAKDSYTKDGMQVHKQETYPKMALTDNAHTLSSGQPMEAIYADHANRLKALANSARKESLATKPIAYDPAAKAVYKTEVMSLQAKLNLAFRNKPLERNAQLIANAQVKSKMASHPDLDKDQIKKLKFNALADARHATGADKQHIVITPREWEAIQSGAITNNKLIDILRNANLDEVKVLATPRKNAVISTGVLSRARAMLNNGASKAEVARQLGVSASTLNSALSKKG